MQQKHQICPTAKQFGMPVFRKSMTAALWDTDGIFLVELMHVGVSS
jgi:hypothetical protein